MISTYVFSKQYFLKLRFSNCFTGLFKNDTLVWNGKFDGPFFTASLVGRRWCPEKGMVNRWTANLYINQLSWALRTHHWKGNIYFWLPFPTISPCAISATNMHHSCWFTDRSVRRYVRCLCLGVSHSCILAAFKGGFGGFHHRKGAWNVPNLPFRSLETDVFLFSWTYFVGGCWILNPIPLV